MDFFSYLQALLLFLAVLGLAAFTTRAAAWRMKARGQFLQVIESLQVGPGRYVVLIRAGNKLALLGSSDKGVALLATMDPSELGDEFTAALSRLDADATPQTGTFGDILKRISRR